MRIEIGEELAGQRVDVVIAQATGLGRAGVRRLFAEGKVYLERDGRSQRLRKGDVALAGSCITVDHAVGDTVRAVPDESMDLCIVLETDVLVVVDKPAGVPSAPLRPGERGSVANALLGRYPEMAEVGYGLREPGLCHRLDTDTSGLMMAARSTRAFDELTQAIRCGAIDKRYLVICPGEPLPEQGVIERPLRTDGQRVRVHRDGKPATTRFTVLERHGPLALVEVSASPATRHQVRVHFACIGAPLVGDSRYGGERRGLDRHALHASRLAYEGGSAVPAFEVESPLPAELSRLLTSADDDSL